VSSTTSVGNEQPSAAGSSPLVLAASGITKRFGGLVALSDVGLEVAERSIVGLVGPNGAGKSTLFAVLSGLLKPDAGHVELKGDDVTSASPQARARRGLARTFQQPELFLSMTVREHLVLAYRMRFERSRLWRDMFDPRATVRQGPGENEAIDAILEDLALTRLVHTSVGALPLGTSRLVEVGRALATEPSVLLLDEPLSGLDVHESENLALTLSRVVRESERAVSLLMVEHDVATVLALSDRIFVLDFGELIASGSPDEIRNSEAVKAAYLGNDEVEAEAELEEDA
jgi:ABC-type branched-subunit amino acid transport system ATPase component